MTGLSKSIIHFRFWSTWRKPIISVFILCCIYCVTIWLCPMTRWRAALMGPICPMMEYTGLWQSFLMFAPGRQQNVFLDAVVTLDTGERVLWTFPRVEKFGIFERLSLERYRKFGHDYIVNDSQKVLWPGFARYIAHRVQKSTDKKPVSIAVFCHTAEIPVPKADLLPPPDEKFQTRLLFSHKVQAEDLL